MKKWIILTLTLFCLLAASSALGETATGGPCYNGHTWGEWTVTTPASYGKDGEPSESGGGDDIVIR